ncbi:hypothetical protein K9L63_00265, partial [Candidatus Gracilibacteria bacterium]|nr:hypothetical protein [Candidatus Gracilibacteria bacterium]
MNETRDIDVDDRNTSGVILPEESVLLSFSTIREHLETKEGAEDNPLLTQAELISEIATLRGKMFAVTSGEDFTDEHYLQFCKDQIDISAMRDSEPIVETLSEHSLLDTVMKYRQKINAHLFVNALLIMAVRVKEQIDYCIEEGMTTVPSALLRSKTEKGQNPDLYNWILSNEVLRSLSFDWGRLLEIVPVDLPCHGHRVSAEPSGFSQYLEFLDRGNRRGLLSGCIVCLGLDNMSDAVHFLQNSVHTRDIALLGEGQEEEVAEIQGRKNRLKESTQKRLNLDRVSAKIIPSLEEMQTRIETGDQDPIHTFYAGPGALQGRDTREVEHIFELVFQCLAGGGYFAFTIEAPNGGIDGLGVPLIQSESSVDPPEAQQNYEGPLYRIFKRAYLTGGKTFVFRDEIKIRELCKKIPGFEVSEFRTAGGKEEDPHCSGEGEVPFYQVVLRKKEEAPQVGIPKRNPSSIQENVFELQSGREVGIRTLSLEDVDQVLSLYNEVDVDNLEDINLFKKRGGIFSLLTQERLQEMIDSEGKDYITRVAT